ncbi:MAG TPA: response regulator [Deltaproteobacteria bacterium]|nr:response regulator [Deltaproteobacteria bacterium]HOM28126.1 response regulator [Deltaproteobacteria bacterium]HPP79566.1 response regulator [Deltaproteobacteria bacterium]
MSGLARILCVDDEPNVLSAIRRVFIDEDYEVLTATSVEDGLRILSEVQPVQVVIADYRMPGINGVDFLKEVCRRWPDSVRIVLSGYADTAAVVDAVNEAGIYKFMAKPWNDRDLKHTVHNAVEHYRLATENARLNRDLQRANDELKVLNENLEAMVEQQTQELLVQNRILMRAQEILDSLPLAVVGVDGDGIVVQANRAAREILGVGGRGLIGMDRRDALPEVINSFCGLVIEKGSARCRGELYGSPVTLMGNELGSPSKREGVVIAAIRED